MYQIGDQNIPLCLNCYAKVAQIEQQQMENDEQMLNYLSDEMDMTTGVRLGGPRFPPRPKAVHVGDVRLSNISVNNSVIGTINTGSIGSLDQSISALIQLSEPTLAQAFKELSEAALKSNDLSTNQRNELIEALNTIAKEATTPPDRRQNTVALSLLDRAEKITAIAADISELCQRYWPIIATVFAAAHG